MEDVDMRRKLCLLALVVTLGLGAGLVMQASRAEVAAPAVADGGLSSSLEPSRESGDAGNAALEVVSDCAAPGSLVLPDGVEAGDEVACCIDQCQTSADCFFRCGGQPAECVMVNSCCRECACTSSSLTAAAQAS